MDTDRPPACPPACPPLTAVVLAKAAVPGRVKTRLTQGPAPLSPEAAARVHAAMMRATLLRVAQHTGAAHRLLAMDDPTNAPSAAHEAGWEVIDQGGGSLGDRIARAWAAAGDGPVAFFGVDCPDVPATALASIAPVLTRHDAAAGPVDDGGYWTLAAARPQTELLTGIDWGTGAVYDQTRSAAAHAGRNLAALPPWHDVDHPADLDALRVRLAPAGAASREPTLTALADELTQLTAD